jgi:hypothetical protein
MGGESLRHLAAPGLAHRVDIDSDPCDEHQLRLRVVSFVLQVNPEENVRHGGVVKMLRHVSIVTLGENQQEKIMNERKKETEREKERESE